VNSIQNYIIFDIKILEEVKKFPYLKKIKRWLFRFILNLLNKHYDIGEYAEKILKLPKSFIENPKLDLNNAIINKSIQDIYNQEYVDVDEILLDKEKRKLKLFKQGLCENPDCSYSIGLGIYPCRLLKITLDKAMQLFMNSKEYIELIKVNLRRGPVYMNRLIRSVNNYVSIYRSYKKEEERQIYF
jgi:hypothetical protein